MIIQIFVEIPNPTDDFPLNKHMSIIEQDILHHYPCYDAGVYDGFNTLEDIETEFEAK